MREPNTSASGAGRDLDDAFVGQSTPGETLFWQVSRGRFVVRAVDELGRSLTQTLTVELLSDGRTPRGGG